MARIIYFSDEIRSIIARKIVEERERDGDGQTYTDGQDYWYFQPHTGWEPWPVDSDVVRASHLIDKYYDPDPTPLWAQSAEYGAWLDAYLEDMEDDEWLQTNGEPEVSDVMAWARENRTEEVEAVEQDVFELTVGDVEGMLPDKIDLDEIDRY